MTTRTNQMHIGEAELSAMARDLDEIHHATLPAMHHAVAEWTELHQELRGENGPARSGPSRRTFLLGGSAAAGALALAACSSKKTNVSSTGTTVAGGTGLTGDLAIAGLAASLENLAVTTYQTALDAATAGKLGTVPAAVATFAMTAQAQHKDHAAAWNSILTGAGKPAVTGVDTTVKTAVVDPGLAGVKDVVSLGKFALALENVAAATYLNGIQNAIQDPSAIKIAATIQPVEMQHAAILNFVLGNYPVPDSFAKTEGARPPSDQIG
jgi:hypothetical protein